VILSAVELGLFAVLAAGPLNAEHLRERLGLHPRAARDFFDTLVALGLLERTDGRYANTAETDRYLDPAKPSYIGRNMRADLYATWSHLTAALRTGLPQRGESTAGAERWDERYRTHEGVRAMTGFFTAYSRAAMPVIAREFPWASYRTLIDIGTSAGDLPVQVALAHPHITGGGFDLPQVGPAFDEYVASRGLGDRLRFYPGSFFTDPLPAADALTMANVLHDWSLEERRLLIGKAHAALPAGGALLVYEQFIDDERRTRVPALLGSLQMLLANVGGANFTAAECCVWMREAGFAEARVLELAPTVSVAVGTK
jgi:hypothetical protein